MAKRYLRTNIPIAKVVIAFQPRAFGPSRHGMEPGRVALFRLGDPRVHLFDCFDGACWAGWRADPDRQLEFLLNLKRELVRECGMSRTHVDGAFQRCREYLEHRREKRRRRDAKRLRKRRTRAEAR
jgi:hypothetical protein